MERGTTSVGTNKFVRKGRKQQMWTDGRIDRQTDRGMWNGKPRKGQADEGIY